MTYFTFIIRVHLQDAKILNKIKNKIFTFLLGYYWWLVFWNILAPDFNLYKLKIKIDIIPKNIKFRLISVVFVDIFYKIPNHYILKSHKGPFISFQNYIFSTKNTIKIRPLFLFWILSIPPSLLLEDLRNTTLTLRYF